MSARLEAISFARDMWSLPVVQRFECGQELWEREIGDWLRADPQTNFGAAFDVSNAICRVWLFTDEDALVGVGSIGPTFASWPKPNSKQKFPATAIPWLAVDTHHQRKGYGRQILEYLLAEASALKATNRFVVLSVHVGNRAVLDWYRRENFVEFGNPRIDSDNGQTYQRMILDLKDFDTSSLTI